ncbi:MAG: hypothetical protein ABI702_15035 [Burkholderiales bacterium]
MSHRKKVVANRIVWRITRSSPMGEWVNLDAPANPAPAAESVPSGWMMSSFDLLRGAEVRGELATVPDSLWDEFFSTAATRADTDDVGPPHPANEA